MTESDTDLVVEYEENAGTESQGEDDQSLSDSNTVNQDQDSFSILEGDCLLDPEGPGLDMPPLFVHITCSVNMKSCHGSMPIQTLPTCLGEYAPTRDTQRSKVTTNSHSLRVLVSHHPTVKYIVEECVFKLCDCR